MLSVDKKISAFLLFQTGKGTFGWQWMSVCGERLLPAKYALHFWRFVELEPGEGLVHISRMANFHVGKPDDAVNAGVRLRLRFWILIIRKTNVNDIEDAVI